MLYLPALLIHRKRFPMEFSQENSGCSPKASSSPAGEGKEAGLSIDKPACKNACGGEKK